MSLIRLNINGKEVTGNNEQTILQIARENNIEIPTLCYDERVKIYGSCGLCVVEVEGIPKLLRACATVAGNGMVVNTDTSRIRASRKTALELLLSDHVGDCKAPCVLACPGETDCQGYVGLIANGEHMEALKLIKEQLPMPGSIGRVCPHPCEDACRRQLAEEPISIAHLKFFAAEQDMAHEEMFIPELEPKTGKKIAIVGGGPGGLTAAYYLTKKGHDVTIYDAMPEMGGMLRYGIPEYRLPKDIVDDEVAVIEKMGAKLVNNMKIGKDIELDYLRKENDAVYVAIGAWTSSKMRCKGEEAKGVIGGIDFLRKVTLNEELKIGDKVAVVGGGNTAMDACRTAIRLGAKEVCVIYRRTRDEMPAEMIEIIEAEEEGVEFKFLVSPIEILEENGQAKQIKLQKMELGEPDNSGRRKPIAIEGAYEIIDVDLVIAAIGQGTDISGLDSLETTTWGTIQTDESTFQTSLPGVFAGGDAINDGAGIAIEAIGDAKKAADIIHRYLAGEVVPYVRPFVVTRDDLTEEDFLDQPRIKRVHMNHLSPEARKDNFQEVLNGYTEEQAVAEAKRCLECGCHDVFECKLLEYSNQYDVVPDRIAGEMHHRQSNDNHPFIVRNSDKCILCGLCVRICDEVMDNEALGIVDRGFDAIVRPALDLELAETNCIACGQCVSVCPTGALQERLQIEKSVPVRTNKTHTVCSHCSVGCNINLETRGDMIYRALPDSESKVDSGLLCSKGRFGYDTAQKDKRIIMPMIRKEGSLKEVTWEEAIKYTAKKVQSLTMLNGKDSVAIAISDRYTNEEIYLAKKIGKEGLGTSNITSFNRVYGGIKDVLGYDASTNTFDELLATETIVLIGSDIMKDHPIAGIKIKNAVANGVKLVVANSFTSHADEWSNTNICIEDNIDFLKQVAKGLIDKGLAPKNALGFEELQNNLKDVVVGDDAKVLVDIYTNSKKAIIVFDQNRITSDSAKMIANIAVIAGHIGKARSGIIQLKPKNNSQGLSDIGVDTNNEIVVKGINDGSIKGMMIFGEDLSGVDLSKLDFLMVQDMYLTDTASKADVVLPVASYAESTGTFTNTERRIQKLNSAIPSLTGEENWVDLCDLAVALGIKIDYSGVNDITTELSISIPEYFGLAEQKEEQFWPLSNGNVLYTKKYNFQDGKAKLQVVGDGKLFDLVETTDAHEKLFRNFLTEEKLI
ncbi:molybdopterin-dependent oxidoreductase [Alkalibaculum sp. M08DMB]|uniref:Molybdopterin-dependent oxidoreductase n=1 Tax=Alkalibaculum sporogenes TaxID=2655001 RepID=A0A6A7K6J7_9FIRM|nr:molybdopterin-dependent oxidoreductase [Alkalibaculum sporogenes]MPW25068.1 molybdopterin-dependent oxidoreductase [Alkalibaculum sporogenes]